MVRTSIIFTALATASTVFAQQTCNIGQKCPASAPCCSQYGQCGVGAYCLGGCDPRSSFTLDSCTPEPVCQSKTYTFDTLDGITSETEYLGDATTTDWVMSGQAVVFEDNVLLTMAPNTVGTLLASASYMWYGNVKATFKTSRDAGVVTDFILLSDVKDEIDYEFVGTELETAQSNYYFQGIPNYNNELNISLSDTFENYHTYEIDWTPDAITWLVDGQVGRTKMRSDTWNATSNQWMFPQTPARVQLSIWPGGLPSNAPGTISWAGGVIDWNSQDIQNNGYYYATFQSVTVSCFNATSPPGTNTGTSYTYDNFAGTNDTVVDGDKPTVLKSFLGTGTNMSLGAPSGTASAASLATVQTIPGLSGAGEGLSGAQPADSSSGDTSGGAAAGTATGSSSGSASSGSASGNGFSQGSGSSSKSGADKLGVNQERVLKGSLFAGIVAVVAMMAL